MSGFTEAQARLEQILVEFAGEVYPTWLKAGSLDDYLNSGPWRHSSELRNVDVQTLLSEDPLLARMHPSPYVEHFGRLGYVDSDSGGGTLLSSTFVGDCLLEAWDDTWLSGQDPSVDSFRDSVSSLFKTLLRGLRGETIPVKIRTGIGGIALPESMRELELPYGWIRSVPDGWLERRCAPSLRQSGEPVLAIFEAVIQTPLTIVPDPGGDESAPKRLPSQPWAERRKWWRNLRFALALVKQMPVEETWQYAFLRVGGGFHDMLPTSRFTPRTLTPDDAANWQRLARLVAEAPVDHIEVAMDRAAMLLDGSEHPFDQLLNAVMVWENLVSATPETTFRICGSLAWILAREPEERLQRFKHLSDIYSLRSKVVHGQEHLPAAKNELAYSVRPLTIEILRELVEHYPELIALKTAPERSKAVLLKGDACRRP